jgi:hypothetical protein
MHPGFVGPCCSRAAGQPGCRPACAAAWLTTPARPLARPPAQGQCHTQQNFHYMGQKGELHANQALRGYNTATDEGGYLALNPLYMR